MIEQIKTYAVTEANSKARRYPEKPHAYRNTFERDRDRIIHCDAFRRLSGKTQVFGPGIDDKERSMSIPPGQYSIIAKVRLPEGGEKYFRAGPFHPWGAPDHHPRLLLMFSDYGPEIRCITVDLNSVGMVAPVALTPADKAEFEKYSGGGQ